MPKRKTILVAPLNWGLGHATRCVPIIEALLTNGFEVLLASDGPALLLLQKEFPFLETLSLPSYHITYPKNGRFFKWHMVRKLPHILSTLKAEKKIVERLVKEGKIHGSISDGRLGIRNPGIPSVYLTHQLTVFTGSTTYCSSKLHQRAIKKFTSCWVPDVEDKILNLSGALGHLKKPSFPVKYIGPLSRMKRRDLPIQFDILILLSGPEPQRTFLETKLIKVFEDTDKKTMLVRGILEEKQLWSEFKNLKAVNFMMRQELETTINQSKIIISRSGYTTLMDLTSLGKSVFFIPTPGQYEQEYLAKRLRNLRMVPSCNQGEFNLNNLNELPDYTGLKSLSGNEPDFHHLFSLFQSKGKL